MVPDDIMDYITIANEPCRTDRPFTATPHNSVRGSVVRCDEGGCGEGGGRVMREDVVGGV